MSGRLWLAGLVALAACAAPAAAQEAPPPTDEPEAAAVVQEEPAQEAEVETQSGGYDGGGTTTTHKPYVTTTTHAATTTTHAPTTTAGSTTTVTPNTQGVTTTTGAPTTTAAATTTTQGATTTSSGATTTTEAPKKVFVCKYVGTPGVDERLQTGDNPISVSVNAIPLGNVQVGSEFADAQGRSVVIAFDVGQPEPDVSECPSPVGPTTTSSSSSTTSSTSSTSTSSTSSTSSTTSSTSTTLPTPGQFSIEVEPTCPDGTLATIEITFGNRPDLNGQVGTLTFSTGGSIPLTFIANTTVEVVYPASAGTGPVTMTYTLGAESVTRSTTFPEACAPGTTTTTGVTTTTVPTTNTFGVPTTTTLPGVTTTTLPGATTTTVPGATTTLPPGQPFSFGAAASVCVAEVPTIRITFVTPAQFPSLVGQTGTLTMADTAGNVVSTQPLVYAPGTTIDLLYPGTRINADGTIADVPGWNLNAAGFWVRDPSDAFLRAGIQLTYVLNPTATALVTYPPESSTCANPDGPFPPGQTPPPGTPRTPGAPTPPPSGGLPPTGADPNMLAALACLSLGAGTLLLAGVRRRKS